MRYSKNKKNVKRNSYKKGGNIVAIGNSPDDRDEQWRNNTLLGNTNIDVDGRRSWEKGIYEQAYNAINTAFNKNKIYHYCLTFMQTFIIKIFRQIYELLGDEIHLFTDIFNYKWESKIPSYGYITGASDWQEISNNLINGDTSVDKLGPYLDKIRTIGTNIDFIIKTFEKSNENLTPRHSLLNKVIERFDNTIRLRHDYFGQVSQQTHGSYQGELCFKAPLDHGLNNAPFTLKSRDHWLNMYRIAYKSPTFRQKIQNYPEGAVLAEMNSADINNAQDVLEWFRTEDRIDVLDINPQQMMWTEHPEMGCIEMKPHFEGKFTNKEALKQDNTTTRMKKGGPDGPVTRYINHYLVKELESDWFWSNTNAQPGSMRKIVNLSYPPLLTEDRVTKQRISDHLDSIRPPLKEAKKHEIKTYINDALDNGISVADYHTYNTGFASGCDTITQGKNVGRNGQIPYGIRDSYYSPGTSFGSFLGGISGHTFELGTFIRGMTDNADLYPVVVISALIWMQSYGHHSFREILLAGLIQYPEKHHRYYHTLANLYKKIDEPTIANIGENLSQQKNYMNKLITMLTEDINKLMLAHPSPNTLLEVNEGLDPMKDLLSALLKDGSINQEKLDAHAIRKGEILWNKIGVSTDDAVSHLLQFRNLMVNGIEDTGGLNGPEYDFGLNTNWNAVPGYDVNARDPLLQDIIFDISTPEK